MVKPGGTGAPARTSSPRLAPLPPTRATSSFPASSRRNAHLPPGFLCNIRFTIQFPPGERIWRRAKPAQGVRTHGHARLSEHTAPERFSREVADAGGREAVLAGGPDALAARSLAAGADDGPAVLYPRLQP